jgi:phosphatidylglycerol:prolipoprotein diacylglycerol transferase
MIDFLWSLLLGGFIGAVLFKFVYNPAAFGRYAGIASFGGIFGGLAACLLYCRLRTVPWMPFADTAAYAFPFGWAFGRLGCAIAHDHPGLRGEGWLTVAYPGGPRYDLGLLELLFMIGLAGVWLVWKPVRPGLRVGALLAVYGLGRIALDTLHVDPPRYAGISVDQASGLLTSAIGIILLVHTRSVHRSSGA